MFNSTSSFVVEKLTLKSFKLDRRTPRKYHFAFTRVIRVISYRCMVITGYRNYELTVRMDMIETT